MRASLRAKLGILPLFLLGLQACVGIDKGALCVVPVPATRTQMTYPPISQRLGETGTTVITVAIGGDGKPAVVTVDHASGSKRLDTVATDTIKARYRWQPPPADCRPQDAKAQVIVAWRLDEVVGHPPTSMIVTLSEADYPTGAVDRGEVGDTALALARDQSGRVTGGRVTTHSSYPDLDDHALKLLGRDRRLTAGIPAGMQRVLVRWVLSKPYRSREIMEVKASRIDLQAFELPSGPAYPVSIGVP